MNQFRTRQRGQVFIVFVLFASALLLALWVLYDAGDLNVEKMRLRNTADNSAYSAGVLVARDMNFVAYTNRAMVANQVAIAQAVGIDAWAHMMRQVANNISMFVQYIPPAQAVAAGLTQGVDALAQGADHFARFMITASDPTIDVLSQAQRYFHLATIAASGSIAKEVAELNDPDISYLALATGVSVATWWDKQIGDQQQVPGPAPQDEDEKLALRRFNEFEQVTKDSRDPFSARRSYQWPPPFTRTNLIAPKFPMDWETRKYGGSDFFKRVNADDKYAWEWAAMDTVSVWVRFCNPPPFDDCSKWRESIPLGWGAAHALYKDADSDYFDYADPSQHGYGGNRDLLWGDGAWLNYYGASVASGTEDYTVGQATFYGDGDNNLQTYYNENIGGLRPFYDFRKDGPIDYGPELTVLIAKSDDKFGTQKSWPSRHAGFVIADELRTEAKGGMLKEQMAALSKAQPYFSRAYDLKAWRRGDNQYEHGNLYNPFWQVHLINPTDQERAAAVALASGTHF